MAQRPVETSRIEADDRASRPRRTGVRRREAGLVALLILLVAVLWTFVLGPAIGPRFGAGSLARFGHSATVLSDGTVLVTGGMGRAGPISSAMLYDPTAVAWHPAGSMADARYHHSATLLPNGKVLVAGGFRNTEVLDSAELYDPASRSWSSTGRMGVRRATHAATQLPGGRVLVAGGAEVLEDPSSAEVFDSDSGT
jgi:Galactose oxidase, central domain